VPVSTQTPYSTASATPVEQVVRKTAQALPSCQTYRPAPSSKLRQLSEPQRAAPTRISAVKLSKCKTPTTISRTYLPASPVERLVPQVSGDDAQLDGSGQIGFKDKHAALAVFIASRAVPMHELGALYGVSLEKGKRIARLFERTGIARLEKVGLFSLHNLQFEFSKRLCEEKGVTVAQRHERLLDGYARIELGSSTGLEPGLDWASKCVPGWVVEDGHDE
jgi:hypothetical protein